MPNIPNGAVLDGRQHKTLPVLHDDLVKTARRTLGAATSSPIGVTGTGLPAFGRLGSKKKF
jgi:hypothetical protein